MAYTPINYYASPGYQMYQQQMQQPTQMAQLQQPPAPQQVRTVYSEAEARQAQIPIDGTTCYFVDETNGKIYTKRFDYTNGAFPFAAYVRAQPVTETTPAPEYMTVDDFERRWAEKVAQFEQLVKPRGGKKADE